MIWIIRAQYYLAVVVLTLIAYFAAGVAADERAIENWMIWVITTGVAVFTFLVALFFLRKQYPVEASLTTNRHAFTAIRRVTELLPNGFKPGMGAAFSPFLNIGRGTDYGLGGSSKFSNVFDHWRQRFERSRGDIFLGTSVWDQKFFVGQSDDMGGCTMAEPRSGKGTSFIIPNLKLYAGSVLVLDGKNGENLDATGAVRAKSGRVLCVDPFGVSDYGKRHGVVRFNPLADLDPASPNIVSELKQLTDTLVVKTGEAKSDHFDTGAEDILRGLIAHLISTRSDPNLADARDLLMQVMGGDEAYEIIQAMAANTACGGAAQDTAIQLQEKTTETRNFLSSAKKHTEWLTDPAMRETLSVSDFSFSDLKKKQGTSLYLVLDSNGVRTNAPFLRLFTYIALKALRAGRKPKIPVLFLLDEFYLLGRMNSIIDNIDDIPGYGVKLWPVCHRIGQLQELYGKNWDALLGGTQVYFCLKKGTSEYLEKELGERGFDYASDERNDRIATGLLSAAEIRRITSNDPREGGNQIIYRPNSGPPLLLRRVNYYSATFRTNFPVGGVRSRGPSSTATAYKSKDKRTGKVPL